MTKIHSELDNLDIVFQDGRMKIGNGKRCMSAFISRSDALTLARELMAYNGDPLATVEAFVAAYIMIIAAKSKPEAVLEAHYSDSELTRKL